MISCVDMARKPAQYKRSTSTLHTHSSCRMTACTSTGLAPQSQERKVAEPSPPIATRLAVPANRTAPVKHNAPEGQCTRGAQPYATVAEETGPHLPSELVMPTHQQTSPAVMNRRPWHAMDPGLLLLPLF